MEHNPLKYKSTSIINNHQDNDSVYNELSSFKKNRYTPSTTSSVSLRGVILSFTTAFAFIAGFIILSCFEFGIVKAIAIGFQDKHIEENLLNSKISPLDYPDIELGKRGSLHKKQNKPLLQKTKILADDPLLQ